MESLNKYARYVPHCFSGQIPEEVDIILEICMIS